MTRSKRFWQVLMGLCYVIAAVCVGLLLYFMAAKKRTETTLEKAHIDPEPMVTVSLTPSPDSGEEPPAPTPTPEPEPDPVPVPIDFAYLQGVNPDIYAWIVIPMTNQEFPVLQNERNSKAYQRRDIYGEYAAGGSLFTESHHNGKKFNDPCTVIYGHNMTNGTMFGSLRRGISKLDLNNAENEKNYITVYTDGGIRKYRIVCAGPYSDTNILYHTSFSDQSQLDRFLEDMIEYPQKGYQAEENVSLTEGDSFLILSTCYSFSPHHRYLVVAVLTERQGR